MIRVKTGIRAEEVRLKSQHVLFVEGKDKNSVDPKVLDALFGQSIRIEPLGASFSVRSVAEALFPYHPTYYFLIDRDHHDNTFIDKCWTNFPDPATHNLLVWRRREIENYFLEPEYLFQSRFCRVSQEELERQVLRFANERLYLDAANHVVTSIREELKRNWIQIFSNPADFPDKEKALQKLKNAGEFHQHSANVEQKVSAGEVERRFHSYLESMSGGKTPLALGTGDWLHMIQGKKVLAQLIHSGCFQVLDSNGKPVTGREKINAVIKDLLQQGMEKQPGDFVALKQLIDKRIKEKH
ncbi:DUF4435 domain-containing protein [Desulfobotulus mexicanus]|uniref:Uncharacterized protein n=1 Tax=Desulfobotulus mexicanus TaxID=2586642 RepID=A0A5Q4VGA0_9BACT|nr:DUF4435 domain-containing protein [Desulfobotulus mexicanus]TYT75021.1 hypothetical protein FIM25_06370 [Desulfobotulus mexicanus]